MKKIINSSMFMPVLFVISVLLVLNKLTVDKNKKYSDDAVIDDSIHKLNVAIDRFGTNVPLINEVFENLNLSKIKRLFKDFGTRYYNSLTGKYQLFSFMEGISYPKPLNLKALLIEELDSKELENLKSILTNKGFKF